MKQEQINKDLAEKESSDSILQSKILQLCKDYVKKSTEQMTKYYDRWDEYDLIYRGYRIPDKKDEEAKTVKEPPKIVVPVTFAQVQTAISFLLASFSQRPAFYEFSGFNARDQRNSFAISADIEFQMQKNKWMYFVYCDLLSTFKYGFSPVKCAWSTEKAMVRVQQPKPISYVSKALSMLGVQPEVEMEEVIKEVIAYEGNRVENISPYNFFPDPSVPIARFQQGKFVAHEEVTSMEAVKKREGKDFFGTSKIKPMSLDFLKDSKARTSRSILQEVNAELNLAQQPGSVNATACSVTEVQFRIIPKKASEDYQIDLGDEEFPVLFVATYVNGSKLVRFERAGYLHDRFTYAIGEYSPDNTSFYNPGLSDTIYELQNLITFFLNSHVANVRKTISNRFVVDENKINMDDIKNNALYIRLKQSGLPIDRIFQQLQQYDVTAHHVNDMDMLMRLVQVVSGINENALGQYAGGRRSATEARNVNAGAAARLKMHGQLIWNQKYVELGEQMLANTRQGRSREAYESILGEKAQEYPFEQVILTDPASVCAGYSVVPFDGTLPSDKQFQASLFKELFAGLISKPESIPMIGLSPQLLLKKIAELHNIYNLGDLSLPQPQTQIMPDQEVMQGAQDGSLVPQPGPGPEQINNFLKGLQGGQ